MLNENVQLGTKGEDGGGGGGGGLREYTGRKILNNNIKVPAVHRPPKKIKKKKQLQIFC